MAREGSELSHNKRVTRNFSENTPGNTSLKPDAWFLQKCKGNREAESFDLLAEDTPLLRKRVTTSCENSASALERDCADLAPDT